ncbi:MAG: hypothetical protein LBD48_00770 [Treponema sp.]|nr:hypothetical protein [Treponema sp.]
MSVRATDSLIAELVVAAGLPDSPQMIVKSVNPEAKLVTAVWFSAANEFQQGEFPAGALDRAEASVNQAKAKKPKK